MNLVQGVARHVWRLIFDGDDTLWACAPTYRRLDGQCLELMRSWWPKSADFCVPRLKELRHRCQAGIHKRQGFTLDLYPNAWVEGYLWECRRQGLTPDRAIEHQLLKIAAGFLEADYPIFDGVIDALEKLSAAGHQLEILTLGDHDFQWQKIERAGLSRYFGPGSYHPILTTKGPEMRLIMQRGPVGRVAMVGDSLAGDISPALRQHLTAFWIKNNNSTWMPQVQLPQTGRLVPIEHIREIETLLPTLTP